MKAYPTPEQVRQSNALCDLDVLHDCRHGKQLATLKAQLAAADTERVVAATQEEGKWLAAQSKLEDKLAAITEELRARVATLEAERNGLRTRLARAEWLLRVVHDECYKPFAEWKDKACAFLAQQPASDGGGR